MQYSILVRCPKFDSSRLIKISCKYNFFWHIILNCSSSLQWWMFCNYIQSDEGNFFYKISYAPSLFKITTYLFMLLAIPSQWMLIRITILWSKVLFQNKLFANTAVLKINQTDVDSIRKQLPIQNSTRLSTANVVSIKLLTVIDWIIGLRYNIATVPASLKVTTDRLYSSSVYFTLYGDGNMFSSFIISLGFQNSSFIIVYSSFLWPLSN